MVYYDSGTSSSLPTSPLASDSHDRPSISPLASEAEVYTLLFFYLCISYTLFQTFISNFAIMRAKNITENDETVCYLGYGATKTCRVVHMPLEKCLEVENTHGCDWPCSTDFCS